MKTFSLNGNKGLNLPFTNLIIIYSLDEMPTEYRGKRCDLKSEERLEHQAVSASLQSYEMLCRNHSIKEMDLEKLNTSQPGPVINLVCLFSY
jgi:hypothetical protein